MQTFQNIEESCGRGFSESLKRAAHTGIVQSFEGGIAKVRVSHGGSCGACTAKGGCASASFGDEGMLVEIPYRGQLKEGGRVSVALKGRTDFAAIVLAFLVPLLLVFAVLAAVLGAGGSQLLAAVCSIASVGVYLTFLSLFRTRLQKTFELMIVE